jgi:hypothetical protein
MGMINGCSMRMQLGHMAPTGMILRDLAYYVSEVEDNWQRTWAWLRSKPDLDAAQLLEKVSVLPSLANKLHAMQ